MTPARAARRGSAPRRSGVRTPAATLRACPSTVFAFQSIARRCRVAAPDQLIIETPEQITLEFALAGIGNRFLALAVDTSLQVAGFVTLGLSALTASWLAAFTVPSIGAWAFAVLILAGFLLYYGYFAAFESFWSGQTPGKRLVGLRVIADSGRPVTALRDRDRDDDDHVAPAAARRSCRGHRGHSRSPGAAAHRGSCTRPTPTDRARCPPPHARRGGGHRELPASPRGFGARRPLEHGTHDRDSHPRPALAAGREQRRNAVGRRGRGVQDGETVPLKACEVLHRCYRC
ncbi:MAG: hypothetical protein DMF86_17240 [Acidobacteria bacterium]|nr:MAG: hypothetical protein DMF86_17240 [Acidobacteriota bacterium]